MAPPKPKLQHPQRYDLMDRYGDWFLDEDSQGEYVKYEDYVWLEKFVKQVLEWGSKRLNRLDYDPRCPDQPLFIQKPGGKE